MAASRPTTAEQKRLEESRHRNAHWKRWGPYLSERAWGTVREDYSSNGNAWEYLPFDQARSTAYRWNEDGIAGICDRHQHICFALALWNGKDPFLKERLFGLTGNQGNHGEDVKEYYFYLDSTPTHSYMKYLYKYPQAEFPYAQLLEENRRRGKDDPEFELLDTGVFHEDRYFDVVVEYAKATPEDLLIRISATNRGPESAALHLLPTIWFRNTWSWTKDAIKPTLVDGSEGRAGTLIKIDHPDYGNRYLHCENRPPTLFTGNETNARRLYGSPGPDFCKDGINDYVVDGQHHAVNPAAEGTKAAADYLFSIAPGETVSVKLRLTDEKLAGRKASARQRLRPHLCHSQTGGRRVLFAPHPREPDGRCAPGDAAEFCRPAVVETVLPLCGTGMAGRRSVPRPSRRKSARAVATRTGSTSTTPT